MFKTWLTGLNRTNHSIWIHLLTYAQDYQFSSLFSLE